MTGEVLEPLRARRRRLQAIRCQLDVVIGEIDVLEQTFRQRVDAVLSDLAADPDEVTPR